MEAAVDCPVCGKPVRCVEISDGGEIAEVRYWHTDLVDLQEFCVERSGGETEQIRRESATA